jgi:hypothetical protein
MIKKWCVVIGKPNFSVWSGNNISEKPNMNFVGRRVKAKLFYTRAEARDAAKEWMKGNPYWKYHAKKVES